MSKFIDELGRELALFADLGTDPPRPVISGDDVVLRLVREGEEIEILLHDLGKGKISERSDDGTVRLHFSYRALLASDRFGHLRQWADNQNEVIERDLREQGDLLPPTGLLSSGSSLKTLQELDHFLADDLRNSTDATKVILFDGPAGIGKTLLIQQLSNLRAKEFKLTQRPLILHVQSRGRVLSNIQDLMAFSLQSLRLRVTYDQVPVLVRRGLVIIAIDGFDELGDPNGYDLAWSQVSDLVSYIRGAGTLILAGRETFIGRERLLNAVKSLRDGIDSVESVSLQAPTSAVATMWLNKQANDAHVTENSTISVLLEEGSYALRPFFLTLLARMIREGDEFLLDVARMNSGYLLRSLIDGMIDREATKFGAAVESALTADQRVCFVEHVLCEVARDMADNQTEVIDEASLAWIVELSASQVFGSKDISQDLINILKNRAAVMSFLTVDDRPRFRRFSHTRIQNYFLSAVTVQAISDAEIPKYIRRNILGSEALHEFCEFITDFAVRDKHRALLFLKQALELARSYTTYDRGSRNLGSLLFACLGIDDLSTPIRIENLDVDDAVVQGTATEATVDNVNLNQLDARGVDLQQVRFRNSHVASLILDTTTRVASDFPLPSFIVDDTRGRSRVIFDPQQVRSVLDIHRNGGVELKSDVSLLVTPTLRQHGLFKLVEKLCRLRQYWIKDSDDETAGKYVNSRWWPHLYVILTDHELIREQKSTASGKAGTFYHIKQPRDILAADPKNGKIVGFYEALAKAASTVPDDM